MSDKPRTKHGVIAATIEAQIRTGAFRPGDRIPSETKLVEEFGSSRPTVARALKDLEHRGLINRRQGSGSFVSSREARGKLFGLLIPGLGETEIFEPICGEMSRLAQEDDASVLWGGAGLSRFQDREDFGAVAVGLCEQYIERETAGVFFAPLEYTPRSDEINHRIVDLLDGAGVQIVLLDRDYLPYPQRSRFDLVGVDNRRVGYIVTRHLIEKDCRRVAFIARPNSASTMQARVAGYSEAILGSSECFDPGHIHYLDPSDHERVRLMIAGSRPDGIVCGNDVTAAHLMHTLDELGVVVPRDMLVTGIDDVQYANLLRVPLTTVHQPCKEIGVMAYRTMRERVESPGLPSRDVLLQCSLVVRQSTQRAVRLGTDDPGRA